MSTPGSRRVCGVLAAAWLFAGATARAQDTQAQPAASVDVFRFNADAGLMIWTVKEDQSDAFESVWDVVLSRLAESPKPDLKALGESIRIFRGAGEPAGKDATYLVMANPASRTVSYSVSPYLLFESGLFARPEAEELFKMLQGAVVSVTSSPLSTLKK